MSNAAVRPADALAVFERQDQPRTPLTTPEVAEALGCARRTAYEKLTTLTDRGALATKKVGARARVWWRPAEPDSGSETAAGASEARSDNPPTEARDRRSEQALRELHTASRRLMAAETHEEICGIAVEAARHILGLRLCGLWIYHPTREMLEPVEWTESGVKEYGEPPPFPVDDSLAGRVFREGTYRAYDDITTEDVIYDPETDVRSELVLPLGRHGVLNASSPDVGAFDAVDVSLGRILAANVETALDRADRLEQRRARRRKLERRRDELETLNELNALVEATIAALVDAATREEIEATVCDRLADSPFYEDARIVSRDAGGPDAAEDERRSVSRRDSDDSPVATAMNERTLQVVAHTEDVPPSGRDDEQSTAKTGGGRATLAVPLTYAETVFGALVVRTQTTGNEQAFSDRERTAFETLGRVVGFVINATNNRRLLLGASAVELEVALRSTDADAWFLRLADRLDATVTVEGLVPTDDAVVEYVTVETDAESEAEFDASTRTDEGGDTERGGVGDVTAVPDAVAAAPAVGAVRVLAADPDRWLLECTVRESAAALGTVAEYGATVRTARATPGGGTVTARFPTTAAPREALAAVEDAFPGAAFVAKRVVNVADRSVLTVRQAVADRLTDKQSSALRAAFLAGYYDDPRGTTAEELAAALDIAPSTLYQHLQAAQRKLLTAVFAELADGEWRKASA